MFARGASILRQSAGWLTYRNNQLIVGSRRTVSQISLQPRFVSVCTLDVLRSHKVVSSGLVAAAACLTSGASRDGARTGKMDSRCSTNSSKDPHVVSMVYLLPCSTGMGKSSFLKVEVVAG
jgi:hypothetical protein